MDTLSGEQFSSFFFFNVAALLNEKITLERKNFLPSDQILQDWIGF